MSEQANQSAAQTAANSAEPHSLSFKKGLSDKQKNLLGKSSMYSYLNLEEKADTEPSVEREDKSDPLGKRENFAVSLRKRKRNEIITKKRRKTLQSIQESNKPVVIPDHLKTADGVSLAISTLSSML